MIIIAIIIIMQQTRSEHADLVLGALEGDGHSLALAGEVEDGKRLVLVDSALADWS